MTRTFNLSVQKSSDLTVVIMYLFRWSKEISNTEHEIKFAMLGVNRLDFGTKVGDTAKSGSNSQPNTCKNSGLRMCMSYEHFQGCHGRERARCQVSSVVDLAGTNMMASHALFGCVARAKHTGKMSNLQCQVLLCALPTCPGAFQTINHSTLVPAVSVRRKRLFGNPLCSLRLAWCGWQAVARSEVDPAGTVTVRDVRIVYARKMPSYNLIFRNILTH